MPQNTTNSDGFEPDDGFVPEPEAARERGFLRGLKSTTVDVAKELARGPETTSEKAIVGLTGPGGLFLKRQAEHVVSKAKEAYEAGKQGKPWEAVASGLEALPIAGPLAESISRPLAEGDVAGATGAAMGLGLTAIAPKVPAIAKGAGRAARAGIVAAAPDVAMGTVKAVAGAGLGSLAGEVPGVGHVARWVFAYPGAKQIATGVGKGATAAYGTIRPKAAVAELPAAETALLDDIAQSQAGKKFASLDPAQQAAVRSLAQRIQGEGAPAATVPPAPRPVAMAARAVPLPASRQLPAPPPAPLITEPPADVSGVRAVEPGRVIVRDPVSGKMKRVYTSEERTPGATPVQPEPSIPPAPVAVRATPEELAAPFQVPEQAEIGIAARQKATTETIKSNRRAMKASAAAELLNDYKITPEQAQSMTDAQWETVRTAASRQHGVQHGPFSAESKALTIAELRKLQPTPPAPKKGLPFSLGEFKQYVRP